MSFLTTDSYSKAEIDGTGAVSTPMLDVTATTPMLSALPGEDNATIVSDPYGSILGSISKLPPKEAQAVAKRYIMSLPSPTHQLDALRNIETGLPYSIFTLEEHGRKKINSKDIQYEQLYRFLGFTGPSKRGPFYARFKYPEPTISLHTDLITMIKTSPEAVWNTIVNLYGADYSSNGEPLYSLVGDAKIKTMVQMIQETVAEMSNPLNLSKALNIRPMQQFRNDQVRRSLGRFNIMYGMTPNSVYSTGLVPVYAKASELLQQSKSNGLPPKRTFKPNPASLLDDVVPKSKSTKNKSKRKNKEDGMMNSLRTYSEFNQKNKNA